MVEGGDEPNAGGGAGPVFISYASPDAAIAAALVEALERHGIACWIAPRDVKAGALYADSIVRAISRAKALVLVLSERAIASSHVSKEIERASSKRRPIIALRIDSAPLIPAFEYFLSESQWVNAEAGHFEAAYAKLINAIREPGHVGSEPLLAVAPGTVVSPTSLAHPKSRRNWILLAAGLAGLVSFAALLTTKLWIAKGTPPENQTIAANVVTDKSIAVLPFVDMSEKHDQEYFADGLADELLDVLSGIPGLRVIGRTSSFQFKGKGADMRSMGAALGAAHIVEGSVRQAGNRIRITAQLIRSVDSAHEWSATYDRDIRDVLRIQAEVAASVARALEVSVSDFRQKEHAMAQPEAYDLYLRGLHALDRYSSDGIEDAINYFVRAIELDPKYLRAYEMLAVAHVVQVDSKFVPAELGWTQVQDDALELLKRNPASDVGHAILCQRATSYTWNWGEAERECAAALAAPRRGVGADYETALLALARGEYAQSELHFRAVFASDPLYADAHVEISQPLLRLGRLPEAELEVRRGLAISPTFLFGHFDLGTVLMAEGRLKEAQHEFELEAPEGAQQAGLAVVYFALGRKTDSQAALGRFIREYGADHPFNVAEVYAYVGDPDHAFEWLDRAYQQRDNWLRYLKGNWRLRSIEGDLRYRDFLHKMKLPG